MNLRRCEASDVLAITATYRDAVLTGRASFEIEPPGEAEMLGSPGDTTASDDAPKA